MAESAKMRNAKVIREKLSYWEHKGDPKAPLSDIQKDSFMELATIASSRPLPVEIPIDEIGSFTQHIPIASSDFSNVGKDVISEGFASLDMENEKIENAQQFFAWFNKVEQQMDMDEEISYKAHCDQLSQYKEQCEDVLQEVSRALFHLEELQKQHVFVSTKTNALHEACEESLREQTSLVNKAETISSKLSYFNELERINTKLSSPTFSVSGDSLVPVLSKLDECITYISSNPHFKESQLYQTKFKSCLSKACQLMRTSVYNTLQHATQQVLSRKDADNQSENAFTLFYGNFRTSAPKVKAIMEQVELRVNRGSEYQTLLDNCYSYYFAQRQTLLAPSVAVAVTELASKHVRDHCALVRSGCAFMIHVCEDEYQLFFHFFSKPTKRLDLLLESLCSSLYDVLRPLIIHINHLETLAELCSILKIEMLQDHVQNSPKELKSFETIACQMLEDVQERLVFRSHIYIQSDILNYKPAPGDLAYPEKLEMMESIAESLKKDSLSRQSSVGSLTSQEVAVITDTSSAIQGDNAVNGTEVKPLLPVINTAPTQVNSSLSPADLHGMWYPTVRRTLVCLSKLYRCIDKAIFQGLSQEGLHACIMSLIVAQQGITKRKAALDGQLFLVKHLLILREQIAPFHVDFSIKETALDFSKMRDAAYGLLRQRSRLFSVNSNNAFLEFLFEGTPQVLEHYIDSKKDVDNQLKKTCEHLIKNVTNSFISDLNSFLTKANVVLNLNKEEGTRINLKQQPFASPEKVNEVVNVTYKQIKSKLPSILDKQNIFIQLVNIMKFLFLTIVCFLQGNVQLAFQQLEAIAKEQYSEEEQQIIACPSVEQVNLLLSATT
ncbi:conserved oligomeric Golgi complex subunit 3-like [Anneissia japonica]|uniref:conserved oligomeric Golgi complex subunit 3-like n=1 Tax=Anneissia japonica TaxID=1529436 RepID=UPI0014254FEF|nr:conserved oligomeric Golgi complex subunit 3-like [Anneissia japonica]